MDVYFNLIPAEAHPEEDFFRWTTVSNDDGESYGIYMVADGCSGYEGRKASERAVRVATRHIKERIAEGNIPDYLSLLQDSFVEANGQMEIPSRIRSTLDVVLIKDREIYVAHVGDSSVSLIYENGIRNVTPEESSGGMPTNFLGLSTLDRSKIHVRDRIHLYECKLNEEGITVGEEVHLSAFYKEREGGVVEGREFFYKKYQPKMGKLLYVFLYTDGLTSRATDDEISNILTQLTSHHNPHQALNELTDIVEGNCRGRLLELAGTRSLKRNILTGEVMEEIKERGIALPQSLREEDLVDRVIELYKSGKIKSLVKQMDRVGLKHDDTTMMLIDWQDRLGKTLRIQANSRLSFADFQRNAPHFSKATKRSRTSPIEIPLMDKKNYPHWTGQDKGKKNDG